MYAFAAENRRKSWFTGDGHIKYHDTEAGRRHSVFCAEAVTASRRDGQQGLPAAAVSEGETKDVYEHTAA